MYVASVMISSSCWTYQVLQCRLALHGTAKMVHCGNASGPERCGSEGEESRRVVGNPQLDLTGT